MREVAIKIRRQESKQQLLIEIMDFEHGGH